MSDLSHRQHVHRASTVEFYGEIHDYAKIYLQGRPKATLVEFCSHARYSRRQVQRALSWHNTSWRLLKSKARG